MTQSYSEILEYLLASDKNILLADTCLLLDIIRAFRAQNSRVVDRAIAMRKELQDGSANYILVLPSIVPNEWKVNVETVVLESQRAFNKHLLDAKFYEHMVRLLFDPSHIHDTSWHGFTIVDSLQQIAEDIISSACILSETTGALEKATMRVVKVLPPSAKGKESTKDCLIFEQLLELARNVRANGFTKDIVFGSSNTIEFFVDKSTVKQKISQEIDPLNIKIVTSLEWAYSIITT